MSLFMLACLMLIYLAMVRPFEEDYLNDLEFFNECCTLGMAYFLILFTDWMPDVNIRWNSGFIMIALIGFNMLVINVTPTCIYRVIIFYPQHLFYINIHIIIKS